MCVLHLNRRLVTEEVALEAVRKDAGVLYDIPQTAITPLVADTAVRGDPRMIQWVPRELRTADLCLYAEAAHPELRVYVPDEIAKDVISIRSTVRWTRNCGSRSNTNNTRPSTRAARCV